MDFVERANRVLDEIDYYRLLNISSAASDDQIQAAYYKLAASLHPDVHGLDVDPEYRRKLTAVFSRVAEAYKVLSSNKLRQRYDRELAGGSLRMSMGAEVAKRGPDICDPSALRFYKLAQAAMSDGDFKSALMNLRFAQQKDPKSQTIQEAIALAEKGRS